VLKATPLLQKSMQRPLFSQSPKRVGSGPSRPPISRGLAGADESLTRSQCSSARRPFWIASASAAFVPGGEPEDDGGPLRDMGRKSARRRFAAEPCGFT
jgi:hypothetical protein